MKGFPRQSFGNGPGLRSVAPEHDDTRVVVIHRQAAIILCFLDLAHVLSGFDTTERQTASIRDGAGSRLFRITSVNPDGGLVLLPDVLQPFKLDLRDASERTPYRDTQLVAPHSSEAGA